MTEQPEDFKGYLFGPRCKSDWDGKHIFFMLREFAGTAAFCLPVPAFAAGT